MALAVPTVTIDDLCAFHATHFPHALLTDQFLQGAENTVAHDQAELTEEYYGQEGEDDLGYYPDGAKRTLTDEQIAIFRHSEIQEVLRKRRLRREDGERSEGEVSEGELASEDQHPLHREPSDMACVTTPTGNTCVGSNGDLNKTHSGRVEKPKVQQWATSSARTKRKNKKHRDRYHAKKKAEKDKCQATYGKGNSDESDEWDPWNQATGPDAQKEEALDLDY